MSLQFELEEHPRSLLSLFYSSSEKDMEVDSLTSVQGLLDRETEDDDIQVWAFYYENPPFPPKFAAGRARTTDLTPCLNDLSLPIEIFLEDENTFTEPSDELINWMVGNPPPTYSDGAIEEQPIPGCKQLNESGI